MASDLEILLASQYSQIAANGPICYSVTSLTTGKPNVSLPVPSGYNNLEVAWSGTATSTATTGLYMQVNGDTAADYVWQNLQGNATTASAGSSSGAAVYAQVGVMPGTNGTANYRACGRATLYGLADSAFKPLTSTCGTNINVTDVLVDTFAGQWLSTAAVTSIQLMPGSGGFAAGCRFSLYVFN